MEKEKQPRGFCLELISCLLKPIVKKAVKLSDGIGVRGTGWPASFSVCLHDDSENF